MPGRRAEHVADLVDRDRAAKRLALRLEPVAHLPIEVGQGEPADAALGRAADLRCFHQRVPQPLRVDGEIGEHGWFRRTRRGDDGIVAASFRFRQVERGLQVDPKSADQFRNIARLDICRISADVTPFPEDVADAVWRDTEFRCQGTRAHFEGTKNSSRRISTRVCGRAICHR